MKLTQEQIDRLVEFKKDWIISRDYPDETFSGEELENIAGLCDVLQEIRTRLISEGFSIEKLRRDFNISSAIIKTIQHEKQQRTTE
jgi:hypothetical protein